MTTKNQIVVILILFISLSISAQNQLNTTFFNDNLWYFNPAANSANAANAKLKLNALYSIEPSSFGNADYNLSRTVIGFLLNCLFLKIPNY